MDGSMSWPFEGCVMNWTVRGHHGYWFTIKYIGITEDDYYHAYEVLMFEQGEWVK